MNLVWGYNVISFFLEFFWKMQYADIVTVDPQILMNVFWAHTTAVQMQIVFTPCRTTRVCVGLGSLGMEEHVQV